MCVEVASSCRGLSGMSQVEGGVVMLLLVSRCVRTPVIGAVVLGALTVGAAGQGAGGAGGVVGEEVSPREQYVRSGLATQEARARGTRGSADDMEVAGTLIEAAAKAPEAGLRALLYERALELAAADAEGVELMRTAARGLAKADASRGSAEAVLLGPLQRLAAANARTEDGPRLARLVARQTELVGDDHALAGRHNEAMGQYQRATSAYRAVGIDRGKPLAEKVALCREAGREAAQDGARLRVAQATRDRLAATHARLTQQLQQTPDDAAALRQRTLAAAPLARLLALEFGEHEAAASVARDSGDAELEAVVPLMAMDASKLTPGQALQLGRWLATAADDATLTSAARTRSGRAAVASLTRFLKNAEEAHPARWAAQQQHERLTAGLAEADKLAAALRDSAPGMEVPEDATAFNGHSYKVFAGQVSWNEARLKCEEMGGYLACITTAQEQAFVQRLVPLYGYWLGGSDARKPGEWEWADGSRSDYTNWALGEPDDYSRDEDYLMLGYAGQWHDLDGRAAYARGFICEWPFERPGEEGGEEGGGAGTPKPAEPVVQQPGVVRVVRSQPEAAPTVDPAQPAAPADPSPAQPTATEPAADAPAGDQPAAPVNPWPTTEPAPAPEPTEPAEAQPTPPTPGPAPAPADDAGGDTPGELFPGVKWREKK